MTDATQESQRDNDTPDAQGETRMQTMENHDPGVTSEEHEGTGAGNYREASYVVLFIAAVFVINAMETGSYRTPWPVAIVTTLAGFGLFAYSWYLQSRPGK